MLHMDTFTPGPWEVKTRQTFVGPIANHIDSGWGLVATMQGGIIDDFNVDINPSVVAANARLIAAAPELLAALRLAKGAMNHMGDKLNALEMTETEDVAIVSPAFDAVRAAIAKATKLA